MAMQSEMEQTGSHYEVFVNFRGKDTRQGLVNALCEKLKVARIRHFYDDESLRIGNVISEELKRAIENSQIYIVILSENYANSKWCLEELRLMLECKAKSKSKEIFPLFCGVSVDDVKRRTGRFFTDLQKHEVEASVVEQWQNALIAVARLKGLKLGDTGVADFSNLVVEEIQGRLESRHLSLSYNLVGMEDATEKVKKLLDIESGDVRYLVIHGKSGTGKTTLAKLIFDQISACFEGCSFVADIRECSLGWIVESSPCDGYKYLKKCLLQDIPGDESVGFSKRFRNKKVLIVLDDVDQGCSIKKMKSFWFGAGSRIIVTIKRSDGFAIEPETKDDIPQQPKVLFHKMEMMSHAHALQLLYSRAFGEDTISQDQDVLARKVITSLNQRFPLTIEIVGSFLYGKSREEWTATANKFVQKLNCEVKQKLKIIYDALDENAKKVFLDIACFFVNMEPAYALYMWKDCDVASGIKVLTSMSLVKVINNKFWMHEELRTVGRDIVCQDAELGKRSRLWQHEEALEVLQRDEDKGQVEGLRLSYDDSLRNQTLAREKFLSLGQLRFLKLYHINFGGNLEDLLSNLRWLSWHHCPCDLNAVHLSLYNLVVLELSKSPIKGGWSQLQKATNLKVLDLRNCEELTGVPEFSECENIERLVLQDCGKLTKIVGSIGKLRSLKCLTIKGCGSLTELPEELGFLEALEVIVIKFKGDHQSFKLPESIGKLKSLQILVVANVVLSEFPDVGGLEKLERLSLSRCLGIKRLPNSLGDLKSLIELDISDSSILCLPQALGNLKELKVIKMERSSILKLPSGIRRLEKLEEIHAKECKQLGGEIRGIDELLQLRILDLSYTGVTRLSQKMSQLLLLQTLHLGGCMLLHGLTELPEHLTSLHISFQLLHEMQTLVQLNNVTDLVIFDTGDAGPSKLQKFTVFQWIGELPRLEHLELDIPPTLGPWPGEFCASSQLKFLKLCCKEMLLQHHLDLPATLSSLSLSHIEVNLSHFGNLQELSYLELHKCKISGDHGHEKVEVGITSLVHFYAHRCSFDKVKEIQPSEHLRFLHLRRCKFRHTQLNLSGLKELKLLELSRCRGLISVQGIDKVEQLEELVILDCNSLEWLSGDISHLKKLRELEFGNCENLKPVQGWSIMQEKKIKRFRTYGCPNLEERPRKRKRFSRLYPSVRKGGSS